MHNLTASAGWGHLKINLITLALVIAGISVAARVDAAAGNTPPTLLRELTEPVTAQPIVDHTVLRSRPASIARQLLDESHPRDVLTLNFFDDATFLGVLEKRTVRALDSYTWIGYLHDNAAQLHNEPDTGAWFIISVHRDAVVGHFWAADGRSYEIRPAGQGLNVYFVHETAQELYEPCQTCIHCPQLPDDQLHHEAPHNPTIPHLHEHGHQGDPASSRSDIKACANEDDGSQIDVIVFYTPSARNWAGGNNAIIALSHSAVQAANAAYDNSQINTQLHLVHVQETSYSESGDFSSDLWYLRSNGDGYMDEVHALRNEHGADLVALISNSQGACGMAYIMTTLTTNFASSAFSVTRASCAVGNLTFAHELGHNMGSHHDRDNAGNALFPYSYGHRWMTSFNSLRRSVMAYAPGTRVPHFSNPDVFNGGAPTGIAHPHPQSADNARSINNAAWTVANFHQAICPPPPNDTCASALVVSEGITHFDNHGAKAEGPFEGDICPIAADVWFGHVARCDGQLTISFCGSDFPAVAAVYEFDCPTGPGQYIACTSNGCGNQAELIIPVQAGQGIRIRVASSDNTRGNGILSIHCQPAACFGDTTGDGYVDVSDLLMVLNAWGPCSQCSADLNNDGTVDVSDMLEVLANWGACN